MRAGEPIRAGLMTEEALRSGSDYLARNAMAALDGDDPRVVARQLLAGVLDVSPSDLRWIKDESLTCEEAREFVEWLERYQELEPIPYILGHTFFYGYQIFCQRGVLIPRPDTETLVSHAIEYLLSLNRPARVLDLCTGTGCVALAIALSLIERGLPLGEVVASDLSISALRLAEKNIRFHNAQTLISLIESDGYAAFPSTAEPFDLIVSNPPYIQSAVVDQLSDSVVLYEPRQALDGGTSGLDLIQTFIEGATERLKPGGRLMIEHGHDQKQQVLALARKRTEFTGIEDLPDMAGRDRVLIAVRK